MLQAGIDLFTVLIVILGLAIPIIFIYNLLKPTKNTLGRALSDNKEGWTLGDHFLEWYKYSWLQMKVGEPIMDRLRNIKWYFRNCWRFRKELKDYRTWDYYYIDQMLAALYEDSATSIKKHGHCVHNPRVFRDVATLVNLLRNPEPEYAPRLLELLEKWGSNWRKTLDESYILEDVLSPEEHKELSLLIDLHSKKEEERWAMRWHYMRRTHRKLWD